MGTGLRGAMSFVGKIAAALVAVFAAFAIALFAASFVTRGTIATRMGGCFT